MYDGTSLDQVASLMCDLTDVEETCIGDVAASIVSVDEINSYISDALLASSSFQEMQLDRLFSDIFL